MDLMNRIVNHFRNRSNDDLVMPCVHPVREMTIEIGEHGLPEIAIVARCRSCGAYAGSDFSYTIESDGRFVIENPTDREIAIVVNGELHHLAPIAAKRTASHVVRPRPRDGVALPMDGTIPYDGTWAAREQARGFTYGDDDEMVGDRDLDEGDKT